MPQPPAMAEKLASGWLICLASDLHIDVFSNFGDNLLARKTNE